MGNRGSRGPAKICNTAKATAYAALDCAEASLRLGPTDVRACCTALSEMGAIEKAICCDNAPSYCQSQSAKALLTLSQLASQLIARPALVPRSRTREAIEQLNNAKEIVSQWQPPAELNSVALAPVLEFFLSFMQVPLGALRSRIDPTACLCGPNPCQSVAEWQANWKGVPMIQIRWIDPDGQEEVVCYERAVFENYLNQRDSRITDGVDRYYRTYPWRDTAPSSVGVSQAQQLKVRWINEPSLNLLRDPTNTVFQAKALPEPEEWLYQVRAV